MRFFILKLILFFIALNFAAFFVEPFWTKTQHAETVFEAVSNSQNFNFCGKLLLGDSTADELYPNERNEADCFITSNRAVTLYGQYLLVTSVLEHSEQKGPLEVHLVLHPAQYGSLLEEKFSFNYFQQPFRELLNNYGEPSKIQEQINGWKEVRFVLNWLPISRILPMNLAYFHDADPPQGPSEPIPRYSFEALQALNGYQNKNLIELHFHSPFLADHFRDSTFQTVQRFFDECGLDSAGNAYIKGIRYLPNSFFRDGIHLKKNVLDSLGNDPLNLVKP